MKIKPSVELAYWTGVVQSDGSFQKYFNKRKKKISVNVYLTVSKKSLLMLKKFQKISKTVFSRKSKIFKLHKRNSYELHIGVKNFLKDFEKLNIIFGDPPFPPKWTLKNKKFFGAYLAGLIDGDGDVRIKRKKYPVCVIRITSGSLQAKLAKAIIHALRCAVSVTPKYREVKFKNYLIKGHFSQLEFLISKKNSVFIKNYILPQIQIKHKSNLLRGFLEKKLKL